MYLKFELTGRNVSKSFTGQVAKIETNFWKWNLAALHMEIKQVDKPELFDLDVLATLFTDDGVVDRPSAPSPFSSSDITVISEKQTKNVVLLKSHNSHVGLVVTEYLGL